MDEKSLGSIANRESGRRAADFEELVAIRSEKLYEEHRAAKARSQGFASAVKFGWAAPLLSRTPVGMPLMAASAGLGALATGKAAYHEWKLGRVNADAQRELTAELELDERRGLWMRMKEAAHDVLHGDGDDDDQERYARPQG